MTHLWRRFLLAGVLALIAIQAFSQLAAGQKPAQEPLATFTGTLHSITDKSLTLQFEDSNTLDFRCSSKTEYYEGDKKVKASQFKIGELVSVEGRRELGNVIQAVRVRREHLKLR